MWLQSVSPIIRKEKKSSSWSPVITYHKSQTTRPPDTAVISKFVGSYWLIISTTFWIFHYVVSWYKRINLFPFNPFFFFKLSIWMSYRICCLWDSLLPYCVRKIRLKGGTRKWASGKHSVASLTRCALNPVNQKTYLTCYKPLLGQYIKWFIHLSRLDSFLE